MLSSVVIIKLQEGNYVLIQIFIFLNRLEHFQFIKIISYKIKQFPFPPLKKEKLQILNFRYKN